MHCSSLPKVPKLYCRRRNNAAESISFHTEVHERGAVCEHQRQSSSDDCRERFLPRYGARARSSLRMPKVEFLQGGYGQARGIAAAKAPQGLSESRWRSGCIVG